MNKKIAELGGMSLPYFISFFHDAGNVEVDTKDYKEPLKYNKSDSSWSIHKHVKKIPFIRGIAILFDVILKLIKLLYEKKLYLLVTVLVLIYVLFAPAKEVIIISEPNLFWDNFLDFSVYLFMLAFMFLATKNHGAEHKLIGAYDDNQDLSLKNIKKQPKENRRCGTILALWILILIVPLEILQIDIPFRLLLIFPLAWEMLLLARKKNIFGALAYFPGWLGQKLTTREPDDKLLLRARVGLRKLLDAEKHTYKI